MNNESLFNYFSCCSGYDEKIHIYHPINKMNLERPAVLSDNNSASIAKGFPNVKKNGNGSVNSDNDSGCALDEYSWVPAGLLPEQVIGNTNVSQKFDYYKNTLISTQIYNGH